MVIVWSLVLLVQFVFLYSLFSFIFTTCFPLIHPKCHHHESHALLQFKEAFHTNKFASLNPLGYPKTASLNSSTDCCSWDGIKCDELTNQVIQIDLSSSELYGTIDANSSLFRLVHLRNLDLSDNDFKNSQIPSRIGELSQLEYLKLLDTNFFGEIPPQISQLSKLLFLELGVRDIESSKGYNKFKGDLSASLANLTKLDHLSVGFNEFTAETISWIGAIFPSICNLKSLVLLDLSLNEFSGNVPSCLGNFSQSLENLILHGNKLSGLIPQTLKIGNSLQQIDLILSNNNLQGQLPRELINSRRLEYFDVSHNNINDTFPFWLGDLPELKVLALSNNEFHGDIRCFGNMTCMFPKLHIIDLSHNEFSGSFPSEIIQSWKAMKTSNTSQLQYNQSSHVLSFHNHGATVTREITYSFMMSNKGITYSEFPQTCSHCQKYYLLFVLIVFTTTMQLY